MDLTSKINEAKGILSLYAGGRSDTVWALYSGGKDSVTAAHIASTMSNFGGVIHIRTTTGPLADEESDRAVALAKSYGWPIIEKSPALKYPQLVIEYGFPGPPAHTFMFRLLKERPINEAKKAAKKRGGNIAFATGIRRFESVRRSGMPEANKIKSTWWISPLINWRTEDVLQYIADNGLEYLNTRECLCGAFAKPGEREEVRGFHSGQAAYWDYLEKVAQMTHEYDPSKFQSQMCKWGHGQGNSTDTPLDESNGEALLCSTCSDFTELDEELIARQVLAGAL